MKRGSSDLQDGGNSSRTKPNKNQGSGQKLKSLREENSKLKRVIAAQAVDISILRMASG